MRRKTRAGTQEGGRAQGTEEQDTDPRERGTGCVRRTVAGEFLGLKKVHSKFQEASQT